MITPYRETGIVLDIGTGDGRFVSASAKVHADKFYIGIDANAQPLEKLSTKITRKPAKGGLANVMVVQAAVEDLPAEFYGVALEVYVNFPWGSLLKAVATGELKILESLQRILRSDGSLIVTIGIDPVRDRAELERLGISRLDVTYIDSHLRTAYRRAGLAMTEACELSVPEWSRMNTSWARKLAGNDDRKVFRLRLVRI